jgi:hypothetical protein
VLLKTRWREDDLTHVHSAIARCTEQYLAATRQPASCASRLPWGTLIEKSACGRTLQYSSSRAEYCHLLNQIELVPELGVYVLSNRETGDIERGRFTAICPWYHRTTAAQFLWSECLDALGHENHVIEAYLALNLPERPINDARCGYSRTRHGTLFRLDKALSPAAERYFFLEGISEPGPVVIPLGSDSYLVFARSHDPHEPLRIMIAAYQWGSHMAAKELVRWLKASPKQKEVPA